MKIGSEERQQRLCDQLLLRECFVSWMALEQDAAAGARHGRGQRSTRALIAGQAFAPDLLQPAFCRCSPRSTWWRCALELARAVPANHA
jgi:hypothetical protein